MKISEKITFLIQKGVSIPNPHHVDIGEKVDVSRISGDGVTLYAGCRLFGASTFIQQGVTLGYEGPVTVEDCHVGTNVELKGGFFKNAVFLKNVAFGSGAHVREGSILEEGSSAAHTVGLKQTILFPFVTLGSLINFCDCLMSGGTDRKNHSEVGSSYIHFNYTPDQHKATASLIGDVARGVMLRERPIFLGGQGGLVGPCRLEYGTTTAAGTICRKDEFRSGRLIFGGAKKEGNIAYTSSLFQGGSRIIKNNIVYIANLLALMQWYKNVRPQFISDEFPVEMLGGLHEKLHMGISERIQRLEDYCIRQNETKHQFKWDEFRNSLDEYIHYTGDSKNFDTFLENLSAKISIVGKDYIHVIKSLDEKEATIGTEWLQSIVNHITDALIKILTDRDHQSN